MAPKPYSRKDSGGNTKNFSLRVPDDVMAALESDAAHRGISVNSMLNSILRRYARFDRHVQKLGMITVPKETIPALFSDDDEGRIHTLVDGVFPIFRQAVVFIKGGYDLKRCIETLEEYMQTTGMASKHTVEGPIHCFTIQHGMGSAWSVFVRVMLGRLFAEFMPDKKVDYDVHESTVSVRISLGADWDEHDY